MGFNVLFIVGLVIDCLLIGLEWLFFVWGNWGIDSIILGFLILVDFVGDSLVSYLVIWKVNVDYGRGWVF